MSDVWGIYMLLWLAFHKVIRTFHICHNNFAASVWFDYDYESLYFSTFSRRYKTPFGHTWEKRFLSEKPLVRVTPKLFWIMIGMRPTLSTVTFNIARNKIQRRTHHISIWTLQKGGFALSAILNMTLPPSLAPSPFPSLACIPNTVHCWKMVQKYLVLWRIKITTVVFGGVKLILVLI